MESIEQNINSASNSSIQSVESPMIVEPTPQPLNNVPANFPPLPTPTPLKQGAPKGLIFLGVFVVIVVIAVIGLITFLQLGKGLGGRGEQAPTTSTKKPTASAAPAFNTRTAPNPACNKSCQTSLDCEAGSGGTTMLLDCVKDEGSSTGFCRNPACSTVANCLCQ